MIYELKQLLHSDVSWLWRKPLNWLWYFVVENESPMDRRSFVELEIQELKERTRDQQRTVNALEDELGRLRYDRNYTQRQLEDARIHLHDSQVRENLLIPFHHLFSDRHRDLIPNLSERQRETLSRMIRLTVNNCTNYFNSGEEGEPPAPASWDQWRELSLEEQYFQEHSQ